MLQPRVAAVRKSGHAILTEVDQATSQLLGWTEEELLGRRTTEFIHPADAAMYQSKRFRGGAPTLAEG